ncbi:intermembrane lipid transfer protein VPS13-like [Humulus lupulus]|uniref:intermembrane lipid transfer protein VPS13-like n=1 Tax=Humulus lupulus TaxID=3486 RepID=UPI002B406AC9|nr:intermembrane lipid transfer protein VPS13-like [Humulus lupulus]
MEMKLVEKAQQLKSEVNQSWLGSLINTIVGNLKLSISNIHIRYEDSESNPGHPFAAGVTLEKLLAVTVDDNGNETFITGGSLDRIQKVHNFFPYRVSIDMNAIKFKFYSLYCQTTHLYSGTNYRKCKVYKAKGK